MDPQKIIADALSSRLSMQISLSSLPVVEEWMDARLTRWLESIPMPMEMSSEGVVSFRVGVSTDLQQLLWGAHGTPRAFIPKLAKYLDASGATPKDLERINGIGETFEPKWVGSWIRVSPGVVTTGWQFQHEFELGAVASHLGAGDGPARVLRWLEDAGITRCSNISAALGDGATVVHVPLTSEGASERMAQAFAELCSVEGSSALSEFVAQSTLSPTELAIGFGENDIHLVAGVFESVRSDDLSAVCGAAGIELAAEMGPLRNALGADRVASIAYICDGDAARIEAQYVPGTREDASPSN